MWSMRLAARDDARPLSHRLGMAGSALLVVFMSVGIVAFSDAYAPGAAFAQATTYAPTAPSIPTSVTTGVGDVSYFTDGAAVVADTTVVDGATAATAAGACAAVTLGTCALAAVGVAGVAYGAYKAIKWAWGATHSAPPPPSGTWSANRLAQCLSGYCASPNASVSNGMLSMTANILSGGPSSFTAHNFCGNAEASGYTGVTTANPPSTFSYSGSTTNICTGGAVPNIIVTKGGVGSYCGTSPIPSGCLDGGVSWEFMRAWVSDPNTPPQHTLRVTITCHGVNGAPDTTVTGTSATFDDTASAPPDVNFGTGCPAGTIPGGGSLTETTSGQPDTPLANVPDPQLDPSNPCSVVGAKCAPLLQKSTILNGQAVWIDAPGVYPDPALDGSYRCEWLGPASTSPRVDGGPLPMSDCVVAVPNQPQQKPQTPATDNTPLNGPAVDNNGDNCFLNGFGWNPVDWVYTPVKCVLQWAFIPSAADLQTDVSPLRSAWDSSPPGVMVGALGGLMAPFTGLADSGDCNGPEVDLTLNRPDPSSATNLIPGGSMVTHPYSMCNPVGQWVHDWAIPIVKACLYFVTFLVALKIIGGSLGLKVPFGTHVDTEPVA